MIYIFFIRVYGTRRYHEPGWNNDPACFTRFNIFNSVSKDRLSSETFREASIKNVKRL